MINKLILVFNVIFSIIFSWILILVTWNMLRHSVLTIVFLIPALIVLLRILKRTPKKMTDEDCKRAWIAVQAVSAIMMVIIAFGLEVVFSWDWGQLIITADHFVNTGEFDNVYYYARYPNNQFWLMILIWMFKFIRVFIPSADIEVLKDISIILSCIFVQLTIFGIYRIARRVWNEKKAFLTGLMAVVCLPLYLFAQYAYTDTSGMLAGVLLVYLYVRMRQSEGTKKKVFLFLLGLAAALTYEIKVTVFIVFIAVIADSITRIKSIKEYLVKVVIVTAALVIAMTAFGKVVSLNIKIDKEIAENYKFPLTHWVMMALNEQGGYSQEDVDYTASKSTYEAKKEANIKEIKKRIKDYGASGMMKHIGYTKVIRTWGYGSLSGDDYVNRYPSDVNGICYNLFALGGKYNLPSQIYMNVYHFVLITGILLSAVLSIRRKKEEQGLLVTRIAVFGLMMFMCIWECNARYLVAMLPILIMTSADGLLMLSEKLQGIERKK